MVTSSISCVRVKTLCLSNVCNLSFLDSESRAPIPLENNEAEPVLTLLSLVWQLFLVEPFSLPTSLRFPDNREAWWGKGSRLSSWDNNSSISLLYKPKKSGPNILFSPEAVGSIEFSGMAANSEAEKRFISTRRKEGWSEERDPDWPKMNWIQAQKCECTA